MASCAVLDIDSSLVDMFGTSHNWPNAKAHAEKKNSRIVYLDKTYSFMWGTKRPHLEHFLETCKQNFDMVGVWSAGQHQYVTEVVKEIFPYEPDFVWTRNDCVMSKTYKGDVYRQKPLILLKSRLPQIDLKRTLIFDDYQVVCEQDTLNHIYLRPWEFQFDGITKPDPTLCNAAKWIKENVRNSDDYRFIPTKNI